MKTEAEIRQVIDELHRYIARSQEAISDEDNDAEATARLVIERERNEARILALKWVLGDQ